MEPRVSLRDVGNLRFRFQMNNRLRLECLAAVSKVFREFGEPLTDELLSSVVFALPQELVAGNGGGVSAKDNDAGVPPQSPSKTGVPPEKPEKPGIPPEKPEKRGIPPDEPEEPGIPPEEPEEPGIPPEEPEEPGVPPDKP